jgi:choline dehydrogenase-like flavoprotein
MPRSREFDVLIIGTGMGGGTLAYALSTSGLRIGLVERGGFLPREEANWDVNAVFGQGRYKPAERWLDGSGKEFQPGIHYYVGGNTKVYGAALLRLRQRDFEEVEHAEGFSPAWPIRYDDLEPFYGQAEELFAVHGEEGADPTEPRRSRPYPYPAISHEPLIQGLKHRLEHQGLHPSALPLGIDVHRNGRCIRCGTCDGFPCKLHAKADADVCCVRPSLTHPGVELLPHTFVRWLVTNRAGDKVEAAIAEQSGRIVRLHAAVFVASCGAINSATLFLRSKNRAHPHGLANSSGLVGRNFMMHNNSAVVAVDLRRRNPTVFQKSLMLNDFYFSGGPDWPFPMGNAQLLGKVQSAMLRAGHEVAPEFLLRAIARRSIDWWVTSEDLPDPENRILLSANDRIVVHWKANNLRTHHRLTKTLRRILSKAGYRVSFARRMGIAATSHQCGTMRFGQQPADSVLNVFCCTHDISNLYVVDGSFFPSSAAVNPALTIAAQALRVGQHLLQRLTCSGDSTPLEAERPPEHTASKQKEGPARQAP